MTADGAFERDLRRWVQRFYLQREMLAAERSHVAVERLFDRERHLLTVLSAQLMLAIAMLPWWGVWGVVAALAILYSGTLISGAWTLVKERRLLARRSAEAIEAEVERTLAACPPLDGDARALLIRLMNLTDLRPTPRGLELLRAELREVLTTPPLVDWRFLHELAGVLDSPDGARLGALKPRPAD